MLLASFRRCFVIPNRFITAFISLVIVGGVLSLDFFKKFQLKIFSISLAWVDTFIFNLASSSLHTMSKKQLFYLDSTLCQFWLSFVCAFSWSISLSSLLCFSAVLQQIMIHVVSTMMRSNALERHLSCLFLRKISLKLEALLSFFLLHLILPSTLTIHTIHKNVYSISPKCCSYLNLSWNL